MRLVAEGVEVRYRGAAAAVLRGADFSVATGETVAILGPSGSGKSTLLSVLGGLVRPTRGTVRVQGVTAAVPRMRDVTAWILQTTNVFSERTALDNVAVAGRTRGLSGKRARAEAVTQLEMVGLGGLLDEPVRTMSGGEVQRIVIARAMMSRRPFVLADEPTGQLDQSTSTVVLDALFASTGDAGVVVVTHDESVARRCGRISRIVDGVVAPG